MLEWKTRSWEIIDLENYSNTTHLKNILKLQEQRLRESPEIDFPDTSGSDSDWAFWADQSAVNAWNQYENYRNGLIEYIKKLRKIYEARTNNN